MSLTPLSREGKKYESSVSPKARSKELAEMSTRVSWEEAELMHSALAHWHLKSAHLPVRPSVRMWGGD